VSVVSATTNYSGTASGTLTIQAATPTFSALSAPAITYGATSALVSGKLLAGTVIPTGGTVNVSIAATGAALQQTATIGADGSFTATFASPALPASTAGYAVTLAYAASGNFAAASDNSLKLVVNPQP
jgi:hypothetical protein